MTANTKTTGSIRGTDPTDATALAGGEGEAAKTRTTVTEAGSRDRQAVALTMALPGTRLDMILGGPHPVLLDLVRALARETARADQARGMNGPLRRPHEQTEG